MERGQVLNSLLIRRTSLPAVAVLLLILIICASGAVAGDYATPNRGETFDLFALASVSGGTVQFINPYFQLNGNLTISSRDTLYFAGGQILFVADAPTTPGYRIDIAGRLLAYGSSVSRCIITSFTDRAGSWYGIRILPTSSGSVMSYCALSNGVAGISCYGSSPTINHSIISQCSWAGMYCYGAAAPVISDNTILAIPSGVGIILGPFSSAILTNNSITDNQAGIVLADPASTTTILSNRIAHNTGVGLYASGNDTTSINANQIEWNNAGIVIAWNSTALLDGNTVSNNSLLGIATTFGASPTVRNTTISDNGTTVGGIVAFDTSNPDLGSSEYLGQNTFGNNVQYDFVNFTTNNLLAVGNTWTAPQDIDSVIYDDEEDSGDADANGFISGIVYYEPPTRVPCWELYK